MTNEQLEEAVARLNELHATGNITEMYFIIRQLWEEREAMEKESTEQCRIIGAGGERELALMTKIEEQRREIEKMAAERDRQRAVMAQAKEALRVQDADLVWDGNNPKNSTRKNKKLIVKAALAALESMGV